MSGSTAPGGRGRRVARRLFQALNRRYAVRTHVTVGRRVHIGVGTVIEAPHGLVIEDDVYIGKYCTIECDGRIGRGTLIGNQVGLVGRADHDHHTVGTLMRYAPWIGDPSFTIQAGDGPLIVEGDSWIGYGAIVLSGTTLGRGSIVAAGAVVTRDVAPYGIVAGVPARPVAMRFTVEEIERHEAALRRGGRSPG